MKKFCIIRHSLIVGLLFWSSISIAASNASSQSSKIAIVVHKNSSVTSLEFEQIVDLFMGKRVSTPQGNLLTPVDIEQGEALREAFYQSLTGLSLARVNAYWSRLKFTGRARPPKLVPTSQDVSTYLSNNQNTVGYLPVDRVTNNLRVVYTFNE